MKILTKDDLNKNLYEYYLEHYGEEESDIWHEQPATNVWVFQRGQKIVALKSHILTGAVTETIEEMVQAVGCEMKLIFGEKSYEF